MGCIFHKDDIEDSYAVVDAYSGEKNLCGMRHGYGTFAYSNGDRYQGTWKWNKRAGYGDYVYADGRKLSGFWGGDEFLGNPVMPPTEYDTKPLDDNGHVSSSEQEIRRQAMQQREEERRTERKQRAQRRKEREKEIRAKYGLT